MDEFAQSREDDDLFADEFEPVSVPTFTVDETPATPVVEEKPANVPSNGANPTHRNGRKEGQERRQRGGRGGGGGAANNGLNASRYASKAEPTPEAPAPESTQPTSTSTSDPAIQPTANPAPAPQNATPNNTEPTPLPQPTNTRTPAVRGDRSATGGPAHKKLTEEELTLKLEKMAVLNAQKAERHRLSEADQAAFQHREKELAKERSERAVAEKRNERVMEMERAKNRERKMKAQGGREWDSEKVESDIVDKKGRSSEYVRGGHGGVIRGRGGGLAGSRYATEGDEEISAMETQSSRGRGTFEIRGRGRGGRGGRGGKTPNAVPTTEDFPSLPTPVKPPILVKASDTYTETPAKVSTPDKPAGDWAEEMATPIEEKKMES
jgi:hypothetical protein